MNFLEALLSLQLTIRTQWFLFRKQLGYKILTRRDWRTAYLIWLEATKMNIASPEGLYYGDLPKIKPIYEYEEVTGKIEANNERLLLKYKDGNYFFLMEFTFETLSKIDNVLDVFYDAVRKDKAAYTQVNPVQWMPSVESHAMIDDAEVLIIVRAMFPNIPWEEHTSYCPEPECVANNREEPDLFRPSSIIMHLNDRHHWTRERIADWLEEQPWDIYSTIEKEEVHVDP